MTAEAFSDLIIHGRVKRAVQGSRFKNFFRAHCPLKEGGVVLELGCGKGAEAAQINKFFAPRLQLALDRNRDYLGRARAAVTHNAKTKIDFIAADLTALPFASATFDACFGFGVLHCLSDWAAGLTEISRVLKPDGYYIFQEPLKDFLAMKMIRRLFPESGSSRFTADDFQNALAGGSFELAAHKTARNFAIFGVAKKTGADC